jgi:hypothetical protein
MTSDPVFLHEIFKKLTFLATQMLSITPYSAKT